MSGTSAYPRYTTYEQVRRRPSVLMQEYPKLEFSASDSYYSRNSLLEAFFASSEVSQRFGVACFCGFLEDTIEVEHCLVVPAIAAVRRLPYVLPREAEQDLYKSATDEGYHAEQAFQFLTELRKLFGLVRPTQQAAPLFLRRLDDQHSAEINPLHRDLITVLNGIVTETRISIELSKFATDDSLAEPVRKLCRSHAEDEVIHSSQFRALGRWLWTQFDDTTRTEAARFLTASSLARSLPDLTRIAFFLHQASGRDHIDCQKAVYSAYTEDMLIDEILVAARPTTAFLRQLGVEDYVSFSDAVELERTRLHRELVMLREGVQGK